jgi:hypothetical protein
MPGDWTVVRVRGHRGPPALDGAGFLGCLALIRGVLGEARWHYRWVSDPGHPSRDGLRVEFRHGSAEVDRVLRALEGRIPPPDSVDAEPLRKELDLDDVQTEEEMEVCLDLLWRFSEFTADLKARNPALDASSIRDLTPGTFLTCVTGDRRHLEQATDEIGVTSVPAVAFGRAAGLIREARLRYRVPPASREDASAAARIHHIAACTLGSRYYPFRRVG